MLTAWMSREQGQRSSAEALQTVVRHTHTHTPTLTRRSILKHKFLSDLPASTFFTAETGDSPGWCLPPQGPWRHLGLVLAAPVVCFCPHFIPNFRLSPSPVALPDGSGRKGRLLTSLGLPGMGEAGAREARGHLVSPVGVPVQRTRKMRHLLLATLPGARARKWRPQVTQIP